MSIASRLFNCAAGMKPRYLTLEQLTNIDDILHGVGIEYSERYEDWLKMKSDYESMVDCDLDGETAKTLARSMTLMVDYLLNTVDILQSRAASMKQLIKDNLHEPGQNSFYTPPCSLMDDDGA